jgi:hypothetical protein
MFRHGRYKLPSRCAGLRPSYYSGPNVSAQPVTFGPSSRCHMYLPRVFIRRQVRNVHAFQLFTSSYGRTLPPFSGLRRACML